MVHDGCLFHIDIKVLECKSESIQVYTQFLRAEAFLKIWSPHLYKSFRLLFPVRDHTMNNEAFAREEATFVSEISSVKFLMASYYVGKVQQSYWTQAPIAEQFDWVKL